MKSNKPLTIIFFGSRLLTKLNKRKGIKIHTVDIKLMYFLAIKGPRTIGPLAYLSRTDLIGRSFLRLSEVGFMEIINKRYCVTLEGLEFLKEYAGMLQRARIDNVGKLNRAPRRNKHRGMGG